MPLVLHLGAPVLTTALPHDNGVPPIVDVVACPDEYLVANVEVWCGRGRGNMHVRGSLARFSGGRHSWERRGRSHGPREEISQEPGVWYYSMPRGGEISAFA